MIKPEDLREAYQVLFKSSDGQTVLEDLERRFHIHGSVFSSEPTDTAYREGQRTVVLFIQSMLLDLRLPEEISNE
jgi:hypothetical protein